MLPPVLVTALVGVLGKKRCRMKSRAGFKAGDEDGACVGMASPLLDRSHRLPAHPRPTHGLPTAHGPRPTHGPPTAHPRPTWMTNPAVRQARLAQGCCLVGEYGATRVPHSTAAIPISRLLHAGGVGRREVWERGKGCEQRA